LLLHLPLRYQDRTRIAKIAALRNGDEVSVEGEVLSTDITFGRRRMLVTQISDGTGVLTLRFFNFNARQKQSLEPGKQLRCYGEVRHVNRSLEMIHPEYQPVSESAGIALDAHLTPVYPSTEGLRQFSLRALIDQLVVDTDTLNVDVPEWLPNDILQSMDLPPLAAAIAYVHRPPPGAPISLLADGQHPTQQRLAFEELLAHHLSMRRMRLQHQRHQAPQLTSANTLTSRFLKSLPFTLTKAQQRVSNEIATDMQQNTPMLRLIQGDVGSGKTVVAALAALQAIEAGYQAAVMAPTEILAYQHLLNFQQWLSPLHLDVAWLAGKIKGKARKSVLQDIEENNIQMIVGTHALFQEDVNFNCLGLIIVDEQHRFGVHQRLALRNKGKNQHQIESENHNTENHSTQNTNHDPTITSYPHQLIMTATPIPRTLAMTAYADLDCSVIDELPPGRTPVETVVIANTRRDEIIARVYSACKNQRQAYWVCTLIEESEALQCQAAQDTEIQLKLELPEISVGLVHGKMKPAEKESIMQRFKAGEIDLLVATTVIEVGVDVPNATLMIIENAERLGLSQLHQLRGRVGRGAIHSACVLLYQAPLSQLAKERLGIMRKTTDGFEVAQRDLEIRGPGELLGTRQTGIKQFHIADLQRDKHLLPDIIKTAATLLQQQNPNVDAIIRRWIGESEQYSNV